MYSSCKTYIRRGQSRPLFHLSEIILMSATVGLGQSVFTLQTTTSVTRFGEISPIWQYSASLCIISKSLHQYLAKFYTVFGKLLCFWANFHCYKLPNIEKLPIHLVKLTTTNTARKSCRSLHSGSVGKVTSLRLLSKVIQEEVVTNG